MSKELCNRWREARVVESFGIGLQYMIYAKITIMQILTDVVTVCSRRYLNRF